jgi:hypothetical protein
MENSPLGALSLAFIPFKLLGLKTLRRGFPSTADLSYKNPMGVLFTSLSMALPMVCQPVAVHLLEDAPDLLNESCKLLMTLSTLP